MEEYIQTGGISSEKKTDRRPEKSTPACGKMLVAFMLLNLVLKVVTGIFMSPGAVAALCPTISFVLVFFGVFGREFRNLLEYSLVNEKNARGKVMGGVAKCFFAVVVITLCLGVFVKLTDLTGIDIFSENIRVSVPLKGFDGVIYSIYMCLIAPVIYELIFRGAVMKSFSPEEGKTAVLISALLFALLYGVYITWIYAFAIGIVLGRSALKTKSIITSIETNVLFSVVLYSLMAAVSSDIKLIYIPLLVIAGFFTVIGMLLNVVEKLSGKKTKREKTDLSLITSGWFLVTAILMVAEDIIFLFN